MDPNAQNSQGESEAVQKLEQDLQNLTQQATTAPPVPEIQPVQQPSQVPEIPPAVPVPSTPPVTPVETNTFIPETPKKGSPLMIIAIILALVAVLAVAAYVFGAKLFTPKTSQTACTMEAKICPDGSSVGRTGPNCEFTVCPTPTATPNLTTDWKVYISSDGRFTFKYPDVSDWKLNVGASTLAASAEVICQECTNQNIESFSVVPVVFKTLAEFSNSNTTANLLDKTDIKFGSLDAIQSIQTGSPQAPTCKTTFVIFKSQGYELIECFKDTRTLSITKSSALPLSNPDILSTFQFIEATPTVSPTASPSSSPSATPSNDGAG